MQIRRHPQITIGVSTNVEGVIVIEPSSVFCLRRVGIPTLCKLPRMLAQPNVFKLIHREPIDGWSACENTWTENVVITIYYF